MKKERWKKRRKIKIKNGKLDQKEEDREWKKKKRIEEKRQGDKNRLR